MTQLHVHFFKLGGTIEFHDPAFDAINKRLMKLDTTIDSYLKNLIQPHFSYSSATIVEKDSRDITEEDRQKLVDSINKSPHENIVITHGTFTLVETAMFIKNKGVIDKKIILTGSMIPLAGFSASDGGFNLGFAIASFPHIEKGVYVSMNGGIFGADEVHKNNELLRFE